MNELNIPGKIPRQIRKWTCYKLECFADYIAAYARTVDSTTTSLWLAIVIPGVKF